MTDFYGIKENGKAKYDPAVEEAKAEKWSKVKDGMTVNLPIIVPIKGKSWQQCKLIFGNMIANAEKQAREKHITTEKMVRFLLEDEKRNIPNGVPVDRDFLHSFMYIISPTFGDSGKPITLSNMNTYQAWRLFKVTQAFLARMEIIIEDPPERSLPDEIIKEMEIDNGKETDKDKV